MSDTPSKLRQTFQRILAELEGEARSAALERHVEVVAAADDRPLLNEALAALVNSYEYSMDSTRLLVPFARLLHNYDTEPEHFGPGVTHSVFWMFKWVVHKMIEHPEVPIASIEEWLGQMRSRYSEAGHSLHPVHAAEHGLADHLGDHERAAKAHAAMTATEPDRMSDCEACRCHHLGRIAADEGEHRRALELWSPVLEGGLRCAHEPHAVLASSLIPLTSLGILDRARANHLHGYQISRGKDDMMYSIVRHIRFCALTGNEARAVEILAAHARFYDLELSPRERRNLLEGVQVTCAALIARGMGGTELSGPERRQWRADDLHAWADAERQAICDRYDQRNGNDAQTRFSKARVAFDDTFPHVPLGLKATPTPLAPRPAARPENVTATAETLDALLAEARAADAAFDEESGELWRRVDHLARRLEVTLEPADRAEVLISRIELADGLDQALATAAEAREAYLAAGLEGRALCNRASMLLLSLQHEPHTDPAEAEQIIAEAERIAEAEPVHALRARALAHIVLLEQLRFQGEQPDRRLRSAVETIDAQLASLSDEPRASHTRARLLLTLTSMQEDPEARMAAAKTLFDIADAAGHSFEAFAGATEYATLLNMSGQFEEGLRVADAGIAHAKSDYPPFPLAAVHLTAAECAVNLGRWQVAEAHTVQSAAHYDRAGETGCAGVARHLMGLSLVSQDRHEEAVVMLEAALADLPSMSEEEHWRLADAHFLLAVSFAHLNEPRPGSEHALEALRLMDGGVPHPNSTVHPRAAHLAGQFLAEIGETDAAIQCYRRSEASWRRLHALPHAANPLRAAVLVGARDDDPAGRETAAVAMAALADELRADWRDGELSPGYREACREELGETLLQHADLLDSDADSTAILREAISVFDEGGYIADRAVRGVHRLMHRLARSGDLEGARSCASQAVERLDSAGEPVLAQGVREHLGQLQDAFGQ